MRFCIRLASKYLVSYPATIVEGSSGSSIPRHFSKTNKKRREGRVIYLENKFWRRKRGPIEMNKWYLC
jgi:hypothetical protein